MTSSGTERRDPLPSFGLGQNRDDVGPRYKPNDLLPIGVDGGATSNQAVGTLPRLFVAQRLLARGVIVPGLVRLGLVDNRAGDDLPCDPIVRVDPLTRRA